MSDVLYFPAPRSPSFESADAELGLAMEQFRAARERMHRAQDLARAARLQEIHQKLGAVWN